MKKFLPYILIVLLVVGFIGLIGYLKVSQKPSGQGEQGQNQQQTENEPYFDENANVMYFYSPNCSFCQKQKPILRELAAEGFRVKPMNIQANPDYVKKYDIKGTPEFISQKNNDKLNGFQEKDSLRTWLSEHK